MESRDRELEHFKTHIDLVAYAAKLGFEVDRRRTSRTSVAMRHSASGERILVALAEGGHFIYASVHDPTNNGTVIDLCGNHYACNLGHVRKHLRPWVGRQAEPLQSASHTGKRRVSQKIKLEPVRIDIPAVKAAYNAMPPVEGEHPYLTEARKIPAAVYNHKRFQGRLRIDQRENIVFPHYDSGSKGVVGYEIKNDGWTAFSKGGVKRFFCSGFGENDTRLVVCESALDLLSYAAIHGEISTGRFLSTAGALNPEQVSLLRLAFEKLPSKALVVIAVDSDAGGDSLSEQLHEIFEAVGRKDLAIKRDSPPTKGQDWNDVLCEAPEI